MKERDAIQERYARVAGTLDERGRRAVAASEALALGWGGISAVARATGLSRDAIRAGIRELRGLVPVAAPGRIRRPGGGRTRTAARDPTVVADLERLVEPATRGDPASPLRWTSTSVRKLAAALRAAGHRVSHQWVAETLRDLGYRLQGNRKTREGSAHPDRDAPFAHLNAAAAAALAAGAPVISVETKKKELVGEFKNGGREWRPKGAPEEVRVHDFVLPALGRVSPYGVDDLAANAGWVGVGIDHDTAALAVATIRRWWAGPGRARYPAARRLLITADGGGSNGARVRLWKWALPRLADATGLTIRVCHLPPGTRKWHTIEHRLCSCITQHWRGKPLVSHAVILSLIAATTTATGLTVESYLDTDPYPAGQKVSDAQMATLRLTRDAFHGDWNYTIAPHDPPPDEVVL
ncbi:MAG TPA: ISAzo13 family transposase [Thermomicrobiales bacterium]|nr:ISAzo13 family transposase [Thermomicrobiales bacterium]